MLKRLGMAGVLACALAVTLHAVSYVAFEQVSVTNTAVGFTAATITPSTGGPMATLAQCRLETAEIRYRVDGLAPTTTVGTLLEPGDQLVLMGHDLLVTFRAIRTGATSGVLDCTYYAQ